MEKEQGTGGEVKGDDSFGCGCVNPNICDHCNGGIAPADVPTDSDQGDNVFSLSYSPCVLRGLD